MVSKFACRLSHLVRNGLSALCPKSRVQLISLRSLCVLCVSAVSLLRDLLTAEDAEVTQRRAVRKHNSDSEHVDSTRTRFKALLKKSADSSRVSETLPQ